MKNMYKGFKRSFPARRLLRISAIVIMVLVWILIDKGNIYGQSRTLESQVGKQLVSSDQHQSPLLREGDGSRDGDLPITDEGNDFVVKPNPVEGDLVFDFEFTVKNAIPVEIYNPLGKLVETGVFEPGISTQKIDLSGYQTGMYIVRLDFGNRTEVRRIIKK